MFIMKDITKIKEHTSAQELERYDQVCGIYGIYLNMELKYVGMTANESLRQRSLAHKRHILKGCQDSLTDKESNSVFYQKVSKYIKENPDFTLDFKSIEEWDLDKAPSKKYIHKRELMYIKENKAQLWQSEGVDKKFCKWTGRMEDIDFDINDYAPTYQFSLC